MSYGFNMVFAKVEPNNLGKAMAYAHDFVKDSMAHAVKMLIENEIFVPSIKFDTYCSNDSNKIAWNMADDNWLYNLFSFNFVYWNDIGLLGCRIAEENSSKDFFPLSVYFQDGSDQNYDFEEWSGGEIPYFMKKIDAAKNATLEDVKPFFEWYDDDMLSLRDDYIRKSYLYKLIFKELHLDDWLYGRQGNFERFTLNGIETSEQFLDLSLRVRAMRKLH